MERPPDQAGQREAAVDFGMVRREAGGSRYAEGIASPRLQLGSDSGPELFLLSTSRGGFFQLFGRQEPLLVLEPGLQLRFLFDAVGRDGVREEYEALVNVPQVRPSVTVPPNLVLLAREALELEIEDLANGAVVQVVRVSPGAETRPIWSSLSFGGPGDLRSLRTTLEQARQRFFTIPGSAFPTEGTYRIDVSSYELSTVSRSGYLSRNHGADSIYGAGLTTSVVVTVVD